MCKILNGILQTLTGTVWIGLERDYVVHFDFRQKNTTGGVEEDLPSSPHILDESHPYFGVVSLSASYLVKSPAFYILYISSWKKT